MLQASAVHNFGLRKICVYGMVVESTAFQLCAAEFAFIAANGIKVAVYKGCLTEIRIVKTGTISISITHDSPGEIAVIENSVLHIALPDVRADEARSLK